MYVKNNEGLIAVWADDNATDPTIYGLTVYEGEVITVDGVMYAKDQAPQPKTIAEIASTVSMTKAEFLLLVTNLTPITLGQIEEYVNSDDDIKIRFTYANTVERNHPMLDSASSVFGVTPELLDIMFVNKDELIRKIDAGEPIEGVSP